MCSIFFNFFFFFFNDTATTEIYTLSLHDALPISDVPGRGPGPEHPVPRRHVHDAGTGIHIERSEEHTSELQSRVDLVCRLLLEKKKEKSAHGPWRLVTRRSCLHGR